MLLETADRAAAHKKLEDVLAEGGHTAECREDPNSDLPYQVWSGPVVKEPAPPEPVLAPAAPSQALVLDEATIDRIATQLHEKMTKEK